jgi:hypothetical protein
MTILAYTMILLGFIILPLIKSVRREEQPVIYKIDKDTSEATYAINEHGFLEDITGKHIPQHYID